jgi:hypothetical protein
LFESPATGGYTTTNIVYEGPLTGTGITSVAVDGTGNVFFSTQVPYTTAESLVYEIPKSTGLITLVTSVPVNGLVKGMAADRSGNVFFFTDGGELYEIPAAGGTIKLLAVTYAPPSGIAVDPNDNVFLAFTLPQPSVMKLETAAVDFGTVAIGQAGATIPLTFTIDSGGTIGNSIALTQGASGGDFALAGTGTCITNGSTHVYPIGDICTVDLTFTPTSAGLRSGAVLLQDNSGNTIATAYVHGIGLGPQVSFVSASPSTLVNTLGRASTYGVAVGMGAEMSSSPITSTVRSMKFRPPAAQQSASRRWGVASFIPMPWRWTERGMSSSPMPPAE